MWMITQFESTFISHVKFRQSAKENQNKKRMFCPSIPFLFKKLPFILLLFLQILDFSLVALFKLVVKIFRQVLKTCSHLMLNPSLGC